MVIVLDYDWIGVKTFRSNSDPLNGFTRFHCGAAPPLFLCFLTVQSDGNCRILQKKNQPQSFLKMNCRVTSCSSFSCAPNTWNRWHVPLRRWSLRSRAGNKRSPSDSSDLCGPAPFPNPTGTTNWIQKPWRCIWTPAGDHKPPAWLSFSRTGTLGHTGSNFGDLPSSSSLKNVLPLQQQASAPVSGLHVFPLQRWSHTRRLFSQPGNRQDRLEEEGQAFLKPSGPSKSLISEVLSQPLRC